MWALAPSALGAILVIPLRSGSVMGAGNLLGPNLLVRALAAALIGGLVSIPRTVVGVSRSGSSRLFCWSTSRVRA